MIIQSLGWVTGTSGTPARATANATDPAARVRARQIFFQALADNTDVVYIGNSSTFDKTTGTGVIAVIAAPSGSPPVSIPSITLGNAEGTGDLDVSDYYIDPDTSTEGVVISYNFR